MQNLLGDCTIGTQFMPQSDHFVYSCGYFPSPMDTEANKATLNAIMLDFYETTRLEYMNDRV